ncbi:MAG: hypothetical protein D6800_04270, partial [Candidatus Zixiibacteriota bacterium]
NADTEMKTVSNRQYFAIVLVALAVLAGGCRQGNGVDVSARMKLASELRDKKLYTAAIEEYKQLLTEPTLKAEERGNISYLIGRIYFDDLRDYENAAAYMVRARTYDPNGSYADEASRKLVAALEKSGRVVDAKRELDQVTDVAAKAASPDDKPVAMVGGTPIYRSEIERRIQQLPPDLQKKLNDRKARIEFVKQYVGVELLYRAATREGFQNDPDIQRQQEQLLKRLVVDRFLQKKVYPQVAADTLDVRNYYLAHKTDRYHDAPYDSVRTQVFLDYQSEKSEAAYSDYIAKLAKAENVKILEQNIR